MIRPLRRRHAAMSVVLLVLLAPAGLLAGVLARPDETLMAGLPSRVYTDPDMPSGRIGKASLLVGELEIEVRVWGTGSSRFVQLRPMGDLQVPDVLVYWTPSAVAAPGAPPPTDAVMIGGLGGSRLPSFTLPEAAADPAAGGSLLLYSLAHKRGLGATPLPVL